MAHLQHIDDLPDVSAEQAEKYKKAVKIGLSKVRAMIVPIPSRLGFVIMAGAAGFGAFAYWQASKSHAQRHIPVSV